MGCRALQSCYDEALSLQERDFRYCLVTVLRTLVLPSIIGSSKDEVPFLSLSLSLSLSLKVCADLQNML